ncbi:MAG: hypothetical protein PVJ67_05155 [Candidatus Pacearchaeota archaeon]|jgi:hypothetical protein
MYIKFKDDDNNITVAKVTNVMYEEIIDYRDMTQKNLVKIYISPYKNKFGTVDALARKLDTKNSCIGCIEHISRMIENGKTMINFDEL